MDSDMWDSARSNRSSDMSSSPQHELDRMNPFISFHKSLTTDNILANKPAYLFGRLIFQGAAQSLQSAEAATVTTNKNLNRGNPLYGVPAAPIVSGLDPSWGQLSSEPHPPLRGILDTSYNDVSYHTEPQKYSSPITSMAAVPWSMDSTAQRRGRVPVDPKSWLPEGWQVVKRQRISGKLTAGVVDKYYVDPTGRRFRSKKEVVEFLETGARRKRTAMKKSSALGGSGRGRSNKSNISAQSCSSSFDLFMCSDSWTSMYWNWS